MWLSYWCIYSFSIFWAQAFGFYFSESWVYYFASICYFIWLMHPVTKGSLVLYQAIFQPILKKYKYSFDDFRKEMMGDLQKEPVAS